MQKLICIFIMLFISSIGSEVLPTCAATPNTWPLIVPLKKTYHFIDNKMIESEVKIIGKDSKPLYQLDCYLNAFEKNDSIFDHTGAFECRLIALVDDNYTHKNLLTDQDPQLRDWHSRGVFRIEEILCNKVESVCIEYPGFRKKRNFRLRGMELKLEITNFKIEKNYKNGESYLGGRLLELELEITVISDPSVTSKVAEPIKFDCPLDSTIKWPEISPIKQTINFIKHQGNRLEILSKNKNPLYVLKCYFNPSDDDSEREKFDYSGDFNCRLTSYYDKRQSTLLSENQYPTRDWENRGRFLLDEIKGNCANYPDYGRIRNFKLRGMDLKLEITKFKLIKEINKIESLELEITAIPDSNTISEISQPSKYKEPIFRHPKYPNKIIRDCSKILMR